MAVLGPVGSGKSSLLKAFLGELPRTPLMQPPQHVAPRLAEPTRKIWLEVSESHGGESSIGIMGFRILDGSFLA